MEPAGGDERQRFVCPHQLVWWGTPQERAKVDEVLRAIQVIACEHFEGNQVPRRATGMMSPGSAVSGSAAATTSGSMPDEANRRSTTGRFGSADSERRTVAIRSVASCSRTAVSRYPRCRSSRMSPSASASLVTATARSASRVKRGSVRTDTASPPTSANAWRAWVRSATMRRRTASSVITLTSRRSR